MARTVAGTRPQDGRPKASRWKFRGRGACGFCTVLTKLGVRHDLCTDSPEKSWRCACAQQDHKEGQ